MYKIFLPLIMVLFNSCSETSERVYKSSKDTLRTTDTLQALYNKGELLFRKNCISCHRTDTIPSVGPGLAGITKRQTREEIKLWIVDSEQRVQRGDPYVFNLLNRHNQLLMPKIPLSDEEIDAVIFYIDGNYKK